jgi:hypothetical protein
MHVLLGPSVAIACRLPAELKDALRGGNNALAVAEEDRFDHDAVLVDETEQRELRDDRSAGSRRQVAVVATQDLGVDGAPELDAVKRCGTSHRSRAGECAAPLTDGW